MKEGKAKPQKGKDAMAARVPKILKCPFCNGKSLITRLVEIAKTSSGNKWFTYKCPRCASAMVLFGTNSDEAIRNYSSRINKLVWRLLKKADYPPRNYTYLWKFKDGITREGLFKSVSKIVTSEGERTINEVTSYAQIPQGY